MDVDEDHIQEMENILADMTERQHKWLQTHPFQPDTLLVPAKLDSRRCIALVARGPVHLHPEFKDLMKNIHQACPQGQWQTPNLHHTFIVARGWRSTCHDHNLQENFTDLAHCVQSHVPKYSVVFNQVIPVRTGIVLCGIPSFPINRARQALRDRGYIHDEPYHLDICHVSILRWTGSDVPSDMQLKICQMIRDFPRQAYITMHVDHIDVVHASWMLRDEDIKVLHRIRLTGKELHFVCPQ